jgi:hypothetical protein
MAGEVKDFVSNKQEEIKVKGKKQRMRNIMKVLFTVTEHCALGDNETESLYDNTFNIAKRNRSIGIVVFI